MRRLTHHAERTAAYEMGVELLTESQYFELQKFGEFDTKTSSWIATPHVTRALGGALFGDRRYDRVFAYTTGQNLITPHGVFAHLSGCHT